MSLKELTEFIIQSLVEDVDNISVEEKIIDDHTIQIEIKINEKEMKKVIGKDGRVIQAIRTIIQEASTLRDNKYVKIEIEKF